MRLKQYIVEDIIISKLVEMTIGDAASFANDLHVGQFRKSSGEPYIKHPLYTYKILKKIGIKDREILIASLLHDTIEDTHITYNEIKRKFSKNVADMVKNVSSNKKKIEIIGKPEYLLDKMIKLDDNSLLIKLADRLQNLSDINQVNKGFAEKMYNQTTFIINGLVSERSLTNKHKKLIRLINKQLQTYKTTTK